MSRVIRVDSAVEVTRGSAVESRHRILAFAVDPFGDPLLRSNAQADPIYLRSAQKPFIAAAIVLAGVPEKFGLDSRDIAIMAGSHMGQPIHVAAVQQLLDKLGLAENDLQCGVHAPRDDDEATRLLRSGVTFSQLHNNCSGKHAGLLALGLVLGADLKSYPRPESSVQKHVLRYCKRILSCEDPLMGTDGCGIPVMAIPLENIALGFARLGTLKGIDDPSDARALGVVRDAMLAHPDLVRGVGSFDTEAMVSTHGAVLLKLGAEGVMGVAHLPAGIGLALKAEDGNPRALPAATVALLRELLPADEAVLSLQRYAVTETRNVADQRVGEIRPSLQ
jgi:L-asparaginase II